MQDNFSKKKDAELIQKIQDDVVAGKTISEAFQDSGKFTMYEYYSLKIGEETGRINKVLKDLHQYFEKKTEQRRKIIGAITYPLIVIITAVLAVVFMMAFIVPMFEEVYQRFDKDLPI
ncbi:MAG: type II secretion system F family protein [Bacteroidota bacterium]|nr:type II secretion system F family protein [Bacteroidota bacterium]